MHKILFVNGNLKGHFNPTLPVVKELVSRGEEVWYFASEIFKEELESVGAHFISSGVEIEEFNKNFRSSGNHPFYTLLEYKLKYDIAMVPVLLNRIQNLSFDVLVYDSYLGGGSFLPSILQIPSICSATTFALNRLPIEREQLISGCHPQLDEFYLILQRECARLGVREPDASEFFASKGDITLVYTAKEFNPGSEAFDDSYIFTGPSIGDRQDDMDFPWQRLTGSPLIYISMGSINTELAGFYKICLEAFSNTEYQVVMSVGSKIEISSLGNIPGNFILCRQAPQLELLKRCELFISHGGLNSINEALYYGVPAIVVPLVNDQFITARQVLTHGLGMSLKFTEITAQLLANTVNTILTDTSYQDNCKDFSRISRQAGGYRKAADVIQQMEVKNGIKK